MAWGAGRSVDGWNGLVHEWQGLVLGKILHAGLVRFGHEHRAHGLTAEVLFGNTRMMRVFGLMGRRIVDTGSAQSATIGASPASRMLRRRVISPQRKPVLWHAGASGLAGSPGASAGKLYPGGARSFGPVG